MRDKLARAGFRGQAPVVTFLFFRFVMPFIVFGAALFYLFVITHFHWSSMMKVGVAFGAAAFGFYLPDVFVSNTIQRRQESIMQAFPDALDLLLICVESGMSIEAAFTRVAARSARQSVELAEEFGLTTAELSYLPDRRQAFENLAKRCGHSGVKAVAAALNQAEKYGTPLGPGAARHGPGKSRNAHAGGREEGRCPAGQADRADDRVLPALPVRRDSGTGGHEGHAHRPLTSRPAGPIASSTADLRGTGPSGRTPAQACVMRERELAVAAAAGRLCVVETMRTSSRGPSAWSADDRPRPAAMRPGAIVTGRL